MKSPLFPRCFPVVSRVFLFFRRRRIEAFRFGLLPGNALMFPEVGDLDVPLTCGFIPDDKPSVMKGFKHCVGVAIIVGVDLDSDSLGAVLKASLSISQGPNSDEEHPRQNG